VATEGSDQAIEAGDPGPVIVSVADELSVDAIVIGSRGRGAIKRALLGSVSTHVANNTECPVVVISDND
jgi:nucleotide-binding universal stress UspA family protein